MNAEKNTATKNVKIRIARHQKPATKGTQIGAGNMTWESVGLKMIVLTNILTRKTRRSCENKGKNWGSGESCTTNNKIQ